MKSAFLPLLGIFLQVGVCIRVTYHCQQLKLSVDFMALDREYMGQGVKMFLDSKNESKQIS
jgi:hypothetical protein